jgi:hypothetical protein
MCKLVRRGFEASELLANEVEPPVNVSIFLVKPKSTLPNLVQGEGTVTQQPRLDGCRRWRGARL